MRLILVRHEETIYNSQARFTGQSDVPLSVPDRRQTAVLGECLATACLDVIVTSDLERTRVLASLSRQKNRHEQRQRCHTTYAPDKVGPGCCVYSWWGILVRSSVSCLVNYLLQFRHPPLLPGRSKSLFSKLRP